MVKLENEKWTQEKESSLYIVIDVYFILIEYFHKLLYIIGDYYR